MASVASGKNVSSANRTAPPRSTAVSAALNAIHAEQQRESTRWRLRDDSLQECGFEIAVASTRALRERAYRLAYEVYSRSGLAMPKGDGWIVSPCDVRADTMTLLGENADGVPAGTITLFFDSPAGLPCDEVYGTETDALRAEGRRLVEVARLAIDETFRHTRTLLLRLINYIFIHAKRNRDFTDFVIEVNPRHAGFYERFLEFRRIGPERACPRVQGRPAVLLRVELDRYAKHMDRRERLSKTNHQTRDRTLYKRFLPVQEEPKVARLISRNIKAMTSEERMYFGLASPLQTVEFNLTQRWA